MINVTKWYENKKKMNINSIHSNDITTKYNYNNKVDEIRENALCLCGIHTVC